MAQNNSFKPVFGELPATSKLTELGVTAGDRLLEVDGKAVAHLSEYNLYIFNQVLKGQPIEFKVEGSSDNANGARGAQGSVRTVLLPTADYAFVQHQSVEFNLSGWIDPVLPRPADTTLGTVLEDSPAYAAGLRSGDRIININGVDVTVWRELTDLVSPNAGQSIDLRYERKGLAYDIVLTPKLTGEGELARGVIGVGRVNPVLTDNELVDCE